MSTLSGALERLRFLEFVDSKDDTDEDIDDTEENPTLSSDDQDDDPEESLFEDDEDEEDNGQPKKGRMSKKKKGLIGGGIGAGIAGSVIIFIVGLLPARLIGLVENLQSEYFASVNSAVDERMDTIVSYYIKKHVMPGLGGQCTSTRISSRCSAAPDGAGRLNKLYRAWSDNRFENKLATKYGLEFGKESGKYYLIGSSGRIDLGDDGQSGFRNSNLNLGDYLKQNGVQPSSRSDVRRAVANALEGESFFKRTLHRFKIGKLLERKYGIKRCVIACDTRDRFTDWGDNKSKAMKTFLVNRVILPRNERFGLILGCLISGTCTNPGSSSQDGERRSALEAEMQQKLEQYAARFGTEAISDLLETANSIAEKGMSRHVIEKVFTKILGEAAGEAAGKAVPIVGWVDLAAQVVSTIEKSPGVFKKMTYAANAAAAVQLYMMYVSHVDEIKSGSVDMELVGSFASALGDVGNGGSAESSPLYQHLFNGSNTNDTAFNMFSGTSFASGAHYVCNGGNPIAADQLVCPEDVLNGGNLLSDILNVASDVVAPLNYVANIWNGGFGSFPVSWCEGNISLNTLYDCAGKSISKLTELISDVPLIGTAYDAAMSQVEKAFAAVSEPLISFLSEKILPSPFPDKSDDISGAKNFTMMAAGTDVSASYYAHYGLGGRQLSDTEVGEIRASEAIKRQEDFDAMPLYARLFDTSEPMSMTSRVAMSMPIDGKGFVQSFVGSIFNLPKLFGNIGSFFLGTPSAKAAYPAGDPFNVVQYGYSLNEDVLKSEPVSKTDEECDAEIKAWEESATEHDDREATHDSVSLCKLDRAVIAAAGGIYDNSLIDEDQNSATPVNTSPSSSTTSDEIVQKIVTDGQKDCPTTHGIVAGSVRSARWRSTDLSFKTCILTNGVEVNTIYAESFALLFEKAKTAGQDLAAGGGSFREYSAAVDEWHVRCGSTYPLDASWAEPPCSGVQMAHPGSSYHEIGLAVDLTCNGVSLGGGTTTRSTFNPNAPCMQFVISNSPGLGLYLQCQGKTPSGDWVVETNCESWHISPTGG